MEDKFCYLFLIILMGAIIVALVYICTRKDSHNAVERMTGLDGPLYAAVDYVNRDRLAKVKRLKRKIKGAIPRSDRLLRAYQAYDSLYDSDNDDNDEYDIDEETDVQIDKPRAKTQIIVPRSYDPSSAYGDQCAPCVCPGEGLLGGPIVKTN